jgi:hypothetical protein
VDERLEWFSDLAQLHVLPSLDSFQPAYSLFLLKWILRGKTESVNLFVPEYGIDKKLGW